MPRRRRPEQPVLPLDGAPDAQTDPDPATEQPEIEPPRRGRPRIWASEAERKRAYRERLAADYAAPERLRRELRAERKRIAQQARKLARFERELGRARAEISESAGLRAQLESTIVELEAQIDFWQSEAKRSERRLDQERQQAQKPAPKPQRSPAKGQRTRRELRLPPPAVDPRQPRRRGVE